MKKNLITVVILALCLVNLVFNILLVFTFMPSAQKTNKLIDDIAKILELELENQVESSFDVANLDMFQLEQGNPVNLAPDASGKMAVLQYGLTINMDKTAPDYEKLAANIPLSTSLIYDAARNVFGKYTYAQVIDNNMQGKIKEELLESLRQTFGTANGIYSISFYNWVAQQQ